MRLEIFQEITDLNNQIQGDVGNVDQVGPALSNRRIENVVVAADDDTIVIGGLIGDRYQDDLTKVPWLGDIPVLGWLFKTQSKKLQKANLLVFLTPHIIRGPDEMEKQSIVKREEFRRRSVQALGERLDGNSMPDQRDRGAGRPLDHVGARIPRAARWIRSRGATRSNACSRSSASRPPRRRAPRAAADRSRSERALPRARWRVRRLGRGAVDAHGELVDAGYEGTLVSSRSSGRVLLELRVGPYVNLDDARAHRRPRCGRAHALAPQVLVATTGGSTP